MTLNLGAYPLFLILISFLEILFILIPAFFSSKLTKKSLLNEIKEMGFSKVFETFKGSLFSFISGFAIGLILVLISTLLLTISINFVLIPIFGLEIVQSGIENAISTQPYNPSLIELISLIIIQIIIIAPCEEAFFRGFLITKFSYKIKMRYAILFSSIIFTFYHIPFFLVPFSTIFIYFPYYFIVGLILALTFIYFKSSIIPCIIAHAVFNILILLL